MSTQTAAVNSQTPDAAAAFTNERNVGVLSVTKNAFGNAVKCEKNGRAVFSFSATLTYADWIDLTQTNNLPTVDGKTPKNMTVDAKNHHYLVFVFHHYLDIHHKQIMVPLPN